VNEPEGPLLKSKPLTDKEKDILQALADGECPKAYAFRVSRHKQTIKNPITAILEKLKAKNSTHVVVIALRKGLIQ
jgi:two-component system NarL family response regulator